MMNQVNQDRKNFALKMNQSINRKICRLTKKITIIMQIVFKTGVTQMIIMLKSTIKILKRKLTRENYWFLFITKAKQ